MPDSGGPYVMVAALCEQVIVAQDGRVSVINVIEQITHSRRGEDVPDEMPAFDFQVKAHIELVGGAATGRFAVKIQPEAPSGQKLRATEFPVQFGVGSGVRLTGDLQLQIESEGLYWIDVTLIRGRNEDQAEELLTRMPLDVKYLPQMTIPGPGNA